MSAGNPHHARFESLQASRRTLLSAPHFNLALQQRNAARKPTASNARSSTDARRGGKITSYFAKEGSIARRFGVSDIAKKHGHSTVPSAETVTVVATPQTAPKPEQDPHLRQAAYVALQSTEALAVYVEACGKTPSRVRREIMRYLSNLPTSFPQLHKHIYPSLEKKEDRTSNRAHGQRPPKIIRLD